MHTERMFAETPPHSASEGEAEASRRQASPSPTRENPESERRFRFGRVTHRQPNLRTRERVNDLENRMESLEDCRVADRLDLLEDQMRIELLERQRLVGEISFLRTVITQGGMSAGHKARPPEAYDGQRDDKVLENFFYDMGQYLDTLSGYNDESKVRTAATFLSGSAKLWWRARAEDLKAGVAVVKVDNWDEMQEALREQFKPENSAWIARSQLMNLKQSGRIRDYIKTFTTLMLEIKDMSEADKLFQFMRGLAPWAQQELRRQNGWNLPSAVAAADRLLDFKHDGPREQGRGQSSHRDKKKGPPSKDDGKGKGKPVHSTNTRVVGIKRPRAKVQQREEDLGWASPRPPRKRVMCVLCVGVDHIGPGIVPNATGLTQQLKYRHNQMEPRPLWASSRLLVP